MEKLFQPNKWFVLFCAIFIAIFAALSYVTKLRLEAFAKANAVEIFTWVWADRNLCSAATITEAKVLKMNANDAVVEVSGEQTVAPWDVKLLSKAELAQPGGKPETTACKAILTVYRNQNNWALGKVELP